MLTLKEEIAWAISRFRYDKERQCDCAFWRQDGVNDLIYPQQYLDHKKNEIVGYAGRFGNFVI